MEGRGRRGVEDKITTVLNNLTTTLLLELNKPLFSSPESLNQQPPANTEIPCSIILTEYKSFLSSTVHFLHAIQELQMLYHFGEESGVAKGVGTLQRQWASRSGNSQNRSFIEQQIACYKPTECFPKNEVLIRGVEVVEYLNDLLDLFD
ncbi:hypothetical protein HYALB_00011685 [Hymenoscyphus albidus]|uniref:Uncharacterized protein n=1 Tax=Hymenoscyphus albidus TaxID=595503 RepID=A0A9N9LPZ5_9HELO|nr:hypothetical protein HYALB_00011685 [Hymenoscyphus albidus]